MNSERVKEILKDAGITQITASARVYFNIVVAENENNNIGVFGADAVMDDLNNTSIDFLVGDKIVLSTEGSEDSFEDIPKIFKAVAPKEGESLFDDELLAEFFSFFSPWIESLSFNITTAVNYDVVADDILGK